VWFIGKVEKEIAPLIVEYRKRNWKCFGPINHYELRDYLVRCDVGVQPSLQEGLSMVIPQMMSCGIPMIITPNTGGENILEDNVSGFVVPIRDPAAIAEKINLLYSDRRKLSDMKASALLAISNGFTWDDYGTRYMSNILRLI
jgi:glycosyltransferase involved in cell wall biosynthesis